MPGFNPDKLNIHDLAVEEPEKETETAFNPEKYFSEEDVKNMRETAVYYGSRDWRDLDDYRAYLKQLTSMEIMGFHVEISKSGRRKIKKSSDTEGICYSEEIRYSGITKIPLSQKAGTNELISLKLSQEEGDWLSFISGAADLVIAGKRLTITPEEITEVEREIKADSSKGMISGAVQYGSDLRIIKNDYTLPPDIMEKAKEHLNKLHKTAREKNGKHDWLDLTEFASQLAILSADELKIPKGGGLELISLKKEKLSSETPQVPEQRNF